MLLAYLTEPFHFASLFGEQKRHHVLSSPKSVVLLYARQRFSLLIIQSDRQSRFCHNAQFDSCARIRQAALSMTSSKETEKWVSTIEANRK